MSNFKVSDADKGEIRVFESSEQTGFFCVDNDAFINKETNKQLNELG
jgi:hypothetical protein